jgi:hypothetical protein
VDFTLIEPESVALLVRANLYAVMVGHVVLQVLSWHQEPFQEKQSVPFAVAAGPWDKLTIQVWPIEKKSVNWPPPSSLSTIFGVTHYGYFRMRFKTEKGHVLRTPKSKGKPSPDSPMPPASS